MLRHTWHTSIFDFIPQELESCCSYRTSPFLCPAWFFAFEASGSIVAENGWYPQFYALYNDDNCLVAWAPVFIKTHSNGDFSWDWQWENVAAQAGIRYHPRLVACIPATPYGNWNICSKDPADHTKHLLKFIDDFDHHWRDLGLAGADILFPDEVVTSILRTWFLNNQYPARIHQGLGIELGQLHSFSEYLACFDKNQRRNIKRERSSASLATLDFYTIDIDTWHRVGTTQKLQAYAEVMERLYTKTCDQHGPWAARFLEKGFFQTLFMTPGGGVVLFCAQPKGTSAYDPLETLALSMCTSTPQRLHGRYWGSFLEVQNLHFELCYYRPIEWAIEHSIPVYDPGAGGEHKGRRGFSARPVYSWHHFADSRFQRFFVDNVDLVNSHYLTAINQENAEVPVHNDSPLCARHYDEGARTQRSSG